MANKNPDKITIKLPISQVDYVVDYYEHQKKHYDDSKYDEIKEIANKIQQKIDYLKRQKELGKTIDFDVDAEEYFEIATYIYGTKIENNLPRLMEIFREYSKTHKIEEVVEWGLFPGYVNTATKLLTNWGDPLECSYPINPRKREYDHTIIDIPSEKEAIEKISAKPGSPFWEWIHSQNEYFVKNFDKIFDKDFFDTWFNPEYVKQAFAKTVINDLKDHNKYVEYEKATIARAQADAQKPTETLEWDPETKKWKKITKPKEKASETTPELHSGPIK